MAGNDIFQMILGALQGAGMGALGDPMAAVKMQQQKQMLQMKMEEFQRDKEQKDLMSQQMKINMKVLEHKMKQDELKAGKEQQEAMRQEQPLWPSKPQSGGPIPLEEGQEYQPFEPGRSAGPPAWLGKQMGLKTENYPEDYRKSMGIEVSNETKTKGYGSSSLGIFSKDTGKVTTPVEDIEKPGSPFGKFVKDMYPDVKLGDLAKDQQAFQAVSELYDNLHQSSSEKMNSLVISAGTKLANANVTTPGNVETVRKVLGPATYNILKGQGFITEEGGRADFKKSQFPPVNVSFVGTSPQSGNPIVLNPRGGGSFQERELPGGGGIQPKTQRLLSEDFKKDYTALGQATDLLGLLKNKWESLNVGGRLDNVKIFGEAKVGSNVDAKTYLDDRDAFLGNISRSIAAERGVLTNQDIDRISKALPKIGANPFSNDSKEEADSKWIMIEEILLKAEERLKTQATLTKQNIPPISGSKKERQPIGTFASTLTGKSGKEIKRALKNEGYSDQEIKAWVEEK